MGTVRWWGDVILQHGRYLYFSWDIVASGRKYLSLFEALSRRSSIARQDLRGGSACDAIPQLTVRTQPNWPVRQAVHSPSSGGFREAP